MRVSKLENFSVNRNKHLGMVHPEMVRAKALELYRKLKGNVQLHGVPFHLAPGFITHIVCVRKSIGVSDFFSMCCSRLSVAVN